MIEISKVEVVGWRHAIRGMRNPMNSWEQSDTVYLPFSMCDEEEELDLAEKCGGVAPIIGNKDSSLMENLCKAGTDHRKFMRFIVCYCDINAPIYWWKEADTYRFGVEKNSCSTMHKIHAKEFVLDDFSHEHLTPAAKSCLNTIVERLNFARKEFLRERTESDAGMPTAKEYWWDMIQLLPSSYNQKRTVMMSYEAIANMYHARKNHKLDEWREFCKWVEGLPYFMEIVKGETE